MPRHILVVPDKFKGTLTAQAAAALIAQGWHEARPEDALELLPMSDGGDGFGDVLAALLKVQPRVIQTVDAAHRPCAAPWWWDPATRTAIIESARVIGLALLPPREYHPFELDTYGLGLLVEAAIQAGSTQILMGIGGSATNDAGFGLARALGWKFIGRSGTDLTQWTQLADLAHIQRPTSGTCPCQVRVAVDVQNPLLGPEGATRVYGPQKGLRNDDFPLAEACLKQLTKVIQLDLTLDTASEPGAGAAGGLGFGLRCFLDAQLESGFRLFARHSRLEDRIASSDLVITGEGAIDPSTLMGKGVGEIASLSRKHNVACIGLAGIVLPLLPAGQNVNPFAKLYGIAPFLTSIEDAKSHAQTWLPRLAAAAARDWPTEAAI